MLFASFLIVIAFAFVQEARATCYFRNGTQTTSDYSPCSSDASNPLSAVCCARWDTCLPNGLCQSPDKNIWRESCTKKNWDDGGCQEICSNERESQRNMDITVTPCDGKGNTTSSTWCCGQNDACCTEGSGIEVYTVAQRFGDPIPTPATSSSSSSVTPSRSASVTTSVISTSSSAPTTSNSGLSTGAKAGIGVGAALGAIALIVLGVFVYRALQWRKKARAAAPAYTREDEVVYAPAEAYKYQQDPKSAQLAEMEGNVHEMPGSGDTSEMGVAPPKPTHDQGSPRS